MNPPLDNVKYVGTYSTVSSAITRSSTNWEQLGSNIIRYDPKTEVDAGYHPGLFYIGKSINRNQADFDTVTPGV